MWSWSYGRVYSRRSVVDHVVQATSWSWAIGCVCAGGGIDDAGGGRSDGFRFG